MVLVLRVYDLWKLLHVANFPSSRSTNNQILYNRLHLNLPLDQTKTHSAMKSLLSTLVVPTKITQTMVVFRRNWMKPTLNEERFRRKLNVGNVLLRFVGRNDWQRLPTWMKCLIINQLVLVSNMMVFWACILCTLFIFKGFIVSNAFHYFDHSYVSSRWIYV